MRRHARKGRIHENKGVHKGVQSWSSTSRVIDLFYLGIVGMLKVLFRIQKVEQHIVGIVILYFAANQLGRFIHFSQDIIGRTRSNTNKSLVHQKAFDFLDGFLTNVVGFGQDSIPQRFVGHEYRDLRLVFPHMIGATNRALLPGKNGRFRAFQQGLGLADFIASP